MNTSTVQQLELRYRGRDIRLRTSRSQEGWRWMAYIDSRRALDGENDALASAELALERGKAASEGITRCG